MRAIQQPTQVIVMGVSGSGKTTVARTLAADLGWVFVEGDDHHPAANIAKMGAGQALDDEDRVPWLMALNKILLEQDARGRASVLSCSALKASYRRILSQGLRHPIWVYLDVDRQELIQRLQTRRGHFMPTDLLDSQFHTLEIPGEVEAIHIDGSKPVEGIVMRVKNALSSG